MTEKIELALDQNLKQKIDIIAKAFNLTLEQFIEISLKKDLKYVKDNLRTNTIGDLELEYEKGVNKEELKKLLLLDEILSAPAFESPLIEVDPERYQKLKKLSNITGISIKDIVSIEMGDFFYSVGDIPVIFLDRHLGIKNIKNPIGMLEQMNDIINIAPKYLEELKNKDLVKHVENWHNPKNFF